MPAIARLRRRRDLLDYLLRLGRQHRHIMPAGPGDPWQRGKRTLTCGKLMLTVSTPAQIAEPPRDTPADSRAHPRRGSRAVLDAGLRRDLDRPDREGGRPFAGFRRALQALPLEGGAPGRCACPAPPGDQRAAGAARPGTALRSALGAHPDRPLGPRRARARARAGADRDEGRSPAACVQGRLPARRSSGRAMRSRSRCCGATRSRTTWSSKTSRRWARCSARRWSASRSRGSCSARASSTSPMSASPLHMSRSAMALVAAERKERSEMDDGTLTRYRFEAQVHPDPARGDPGRPGLLRALLPALVLRGLPARARLGRGPARLQRAPPHGLRRPVPCYGGDAPRRLDPARAALGRDLARRLPRLQPAPHDLAPLQPRAVLDRQRDRQRRDPGGDGPPADRRPLSRLEGERSSAEARSLPGRAPTASASTRSRTRHEIR